MSDLSQIEEEPVTMEDLEGNPYQYDLPNGNRRIADTPKGPELRSEIRDEAARREKHDVALTVWNKETGELQKAVYRMDAGDLWKDVKERHLSMERYVERITKYSDNPINAKDIGWYRLDRLND